MSSPVRVAPHSTRCKFCGEPIEWQWVRMGHKQDKLGRDRHRWAPVSPEHDPEGRVVLWEGEWQYQRPRRTIKDGVERRRLHGAIECASDQLQENEDKQ